MLVAASFSLLGFTMPTPILPMLRQSFGLTASQVGLVSSSFAAGMFFAVMVLPGISDSYGRRPVTAVALMLTSVGFLAQGLVLAFGWGFQAFLIARTVTGLFAGCNPIFKAYLADVAPPSRLPQLIVWREASATVAFVIGPWLGGLLASTRVGPSGPLYATAAGHLCAAWLVCFVVEESVDLRRTTGKPGMSAQTAARQEEDAFNWALIGLVFGMSFIYVIGQSCVSSFFALLMTDMFEASPSRIGRVSASFSLFALAFQVFAYKPMHRRVGLCRAGAIGAAAIGLGLAGLGTKAVPLWLAAGVYAVGVATFPATVPTLLTGAVPGSRKGLALGVDSIVNNVCRVFAPFLLGALYSRSPGLCFQVAGSLMLVVVAALLMLARNPRFGHASR